MPLQLRFSDLALQDIDAALEYSEEHFGLSGNQRYARLIDQAIADLKERPLRIGTQLLDADSRSFYIYHIKRSNRKLPLTERVGKPRHCLFFRFDDEYLYVYRLLHDSMDFIQHLPSSL